VPRIGIIIELHGQRHAHPAPGAKIADFLRQQRLDPTVLKPGIGRIRRPNRRRRDKQR